MQDCKFLCHTFTFTFTYETGFSLTLTCHIQHFVLERIIRVNRSMRCYFTTLPVFNTMLTEEKWRGLKPFFGLNGKERAIRMIDTMWRRLCKCVIEEPWTARYRRAF